jgi:hypothetical protein
MPAKIEVILTEDGPTELNRGDLLGREVEYRLQRHQDKLVIIGGLAWAPPTAERIVVVIKQW